MGEIDPQAWLADVLARIVARSSAERAAALELDITDFSALCSSGITMHVNKVHHVTTINHVAEDLGEDEDWPRDISIDMEIEDGAIWVYGVGEDRVQAFTDFGIENRIQPIKLYTWIAQALLLRPTPNGYTSRAPRW